jgi:hypothetical protein
VCKYSKMELGKTDLCKAAFSCTYSLKRDIANARSENKKLFECEVCKKLFASKYIRDRHQRTICALNKMSGHPSNGIVSVGEAAAAMVIEEVVRKMVQKVCGKSCKSGVTFACGKCGKGFYRKGNMLNHAEKCGIKRTEEQGRQTFNCEKCNRNFTRLGNLKTHTEKCGIKRKAEEEMGNEQKKKVNEERGSEGLSNLNHLRANQDNAIEEKIGEVKCKCCMIIEKDAMEKEIDVMDGTGAGSPPPPPPPPTLSITDRYTRCTPEQAVKALVEQVDAGWRRKQKRICTLCSMTFWTASYLANHIRWDHLKIQDDACKHCNQKFGFRIGKIASPDIGIHRECGPAQCMLCSRQFSSTNKMMTHAWECIGPDPQCEICSIMFDCKLDRHHHMIEMHRQLCDRCGKEFVDLQRHTACEGGVLDQ